MAFSDLRKSSVSDQVSGQTATAQGFAGDMCSGRTRSREEIIEELFSYHSPRLDQVPRYEAIREAAKYFAKVLLHNTPAGADQSAAIRKLRECVMTANASIALDGLTF